MWEQCSVQCRYNCLFRYATTGLKKRKSLCRSSTARHCTCAHCESLHDSWQENPVSLHITLLTKNQSTSTRHRKKTAFNFLPRPSADARYSIPLCLCSQGIALWPYGDIQMGLVIELQLKLTESGREYPKLNCQVSHCLIGVNSNDFFVVAVMYIAFILHDLE